MKVINLKAENFKKLVAVEIEPGSENVMKISGKNGAGKTSVLDAIWVALGGHKATKNLPEPVRKGEEKAVISLDLGDLVINRRFSSKGTTALTVVNADGDKFASPQKMLDELVGEMTFDPLLFTRLSPKEQQETLLGLIDLPFDLDELDAKRDKFYDDRRFVNRSLRDVQGSISKLEEEGVEVKESEGEHDISSIVDELGAARDMNLAFQFAKRDLASCEALAESLEDEISSMEEKLSSLKEKIVDKEVELAELEEVDLQPLKDRLAEAELQQDSSAQSNSLKEFRENEKTLSEKSKLLSRRMEKIKSKKEKALKEADMPIDGLGIGEDGHVTYNDNPFEQCSAAEQLRVSVAMAMALNPKVRIIRITDGSLLDEDSMAIIEELAGDNDYQVWIEIVDSSGDVGLFIENGEITNG